MQYAYDEMSRVTRVTPAQGTNYRTDYAFNKNGSLDTATTYDNGTGAETSYTYNTTSGKLAQRNLPESGRQNIRTSYPAVGGTGWTTTASPTSTTAWSGRTTKSARTKA